VTKTSSLDEPELLAWLGDIARQDQKAMQRFYQHMAPSVYQFSMRRLSDPTQAQEVTVETMFEVWRHATGFAGQSSIRTWVLGIARHKLLDKLRDRYRHAHESFEEENDYQQADMESDAPSGFDRVVQQENRDMIAHCANKLPDEQREALHLAFYEDLSLLEIAQVQSCPENTVKTRLFHARRKLKECLQRLMKETPVGERHE
jgi:RNA polymerase sigma-70 factor, ECF subfamily